MSGARRVSAPTLVGAALLAVLLAVGCDDGNGEPTTHDVIEDVVPDTAMPDTAGPDDTTPDSDVPSGPVCDPACSGGLDCCRDGCVDLATSVTDCGVCGRVCLPGQICDAGRCGKPCELGCSIGQVCSDGFCVADCAPGEVECDGACVDLRSSSAHCGGCGQACESSEVCASGACAAQCPRTERFCDEACVDITASRRHCGACGQLCGVDEVCAFGACVATGCPEGLTACDGACVDLRSDPRNCGACGSPCEIGAVCQAGVCVDTCSDDLTDCDGRCLDLRSDPASCGRCGRFCFPGQVCEAGSCASSCGAGLESCGAFCVDTADSRAHCGGCFAACAPREACQAGACACDVGFEDCNGEPVDGCEAELDADATNCGGCGIICAANEVCAEGECTCGDGFADCDLDATNGCEVPVEPGERCVCEPGTVEACYTGPAGTANVGACAEGTRVCLATGLGWSDCTGETLPATEDCTNGIDDDCNGTADDGSDLDMDGFRSCQDDCCDSTAQCDEPALVHPGAFEFGDNGLDDDCDGQIDNALPTTCSTTQNLGAVTASQLAAAMDICWEPSANLEGWGLLDATLTRADGSGTVESVQTAVMTSFGAPVTPLANATMAVLSSGTARAVGQSGYIDPSSSWSGVGSAVSAPAVYLAAHGGQLEAAQGCPSGDSDVNDSVRLRLRLKVPSNARGLSFDLRFMSSEAPEWLCSEYNDFFLALLDSSHQAIPMDTNISFDSNANPISVNNAFFTTCQPQTCGYSFSGTDGDADGCPDSLVCNASNQCAPSATDVACPDGTAELVGYTSMVADAGGTSWLTSLAPVVPGEEIELHLHVWDTSDQSLDSTVLLDNFQWRFQPTNVITEPQ